MYILNLRGIAKVGGGGGGQGGPWPPPLAEGRGLPPHLPHQDARTQFVKWQRVDRAPLEGKTRILGSFGPVCSAV